MGLLQPLPISDLIWDEVLIVWRLSIHFSSYPPGSSLGFPTYLYLLQFKDPSDNRASLPPEAEGLPKNLIAGAHIANNNVFRGIVQRGSVYGKEELKRLPWWASGTTALWLVEPHHHLVVDVGFMGEGRVSPPHRQPMWPHGKPMSS